MSTKQCYKCKTTQPTTNFYRNKTRKDHLQAECKQCSKQYKKLLKTKLYHRQYTKKTVKTQKYRARNRLQKSPHLYPLMVTCELCTNPATQHHHPDYNYPTIYISTCTECHAYIHHP